jgi:hypothetical protein
MRVITVNSVYAAAEEALNALVHNGKDGEITQGSSTGSTIISIAQTV